MCGPRVEASVDQPVDLVLAALRDNGRTKGIQQRLSATPASEYPHMAHIVWMNQPRERRCLVLGVQTTLMVDDDLQPLFAGLVEGDSPGRINIRLWGNKPREPIAVAHAAHILGASALVRVTAVRVRGYPPALAVATDEHAQVWRAVLPPPLGSATASSCPSAPLPTQCST